MLGSQSVFFLHRYSVYNNSYNRERNKTHFKGKNFQIDKQQDKIYQDKVKLSPSIIYYIAGNISNRNKKAVVKSSARKMIAA